MKRLGLWKWLQLGAMRSVLEGGVVKGGIFRLQGTDTDRVEEQLIGQRQRKPLPVSQRR